MQRLTAAMTLVFLALAVAPSDPATVVVSITAALVVGLIALRSASLAALTRASSRVGRRAPAHRQVLDRSPEPQHPLTAGRPRTRAPGLALLAA